MGYYMLIYNNFDNIDNKFRAVTIGNFDGIHNGHKQLIEKTKKIAQENKIISSLITFDINSFDKLIKKDVEHIITEKDKIELVKEYNIDEFFKLKFNQNFMSTSCEDFIKILKVTINLKHLILGFDAKLGNDQQGVDYIKQVCENNDVTFHIIPEYSINNEKVSSTVIREMIREGVVDDRLYEYLGRDYKISGKVVHGKNIGQSIFEIPTANIEMDFNYCVPKYGVYYCKFEIDDEIYDSAVSVGTNPTIRNKEEKLSIEAFIFNFKDNLYGKNVNLYFKEFIRDEIKFNSYEELKFQMKKDIEEIEKKSFT